MSAKSNDQGRAYEYAWIQALGTVLSKKRKTRIVKNSSLEANTRSWFIMDSKMQETFMISADAAIDTILELEPKLLENDGDELTLEFQTDKKGEEGDVRDVVIRRGAIGWEIGLSIKHNHKDAKHSRLSHRLDFGKKWYGTPCSNEYWSDVKPIFNRLKEAKARKELWVNLQNKENEVYIPLLTAFMNEINRAYGRDSDLPQKLIEYLIGGKDYYKVISNDRNNLTIIQTFNVHGNLNKPSKVKVSAITVPVLALPTEIVALRLKPDTDNTVEMYLNNGWEISYRIHNASSKVEPSLKFAIDFVGVPATLLSIECKWNRKI